MNVPLLIAPSSDVCSNINAGANGFAPVSQNAVNIVTYELRLFEDTMSRTRPRA